MREFVMPKEKTLMVGQNRQSHTKKRQVNYSKPYWSVPQICLLLLGYAALGVIGFFLGVAARVVL